MYACVGCVRAWIKSVQTRRSLLSSPRLRCVQVSSSCRLSSEWRSLTACRLDNAAMIAWASMHRFMAGHTDDYMVETRPRWSLEDLEREEAGPSRV